MTEKILVKILEWMKENKGMWKLQILFNIVTWMTFIILFIYVAVFK